MNYGEEQLRAYGVQIKMDKFIKVAIQCVTRATTLAARIRIIYSQVESAWAGNLEIHRVAPWLPLIFKGENITNIQEGQTASRSSSKWI